MDAIVSSSRRSRSPRGLRMFNILLLILQAFAGVVVAAMMATRDSYAAISRQVVGGEAQLMGSALADLLVRKEAIVLVGVVLVLQVWKESKVQGLGARILWNLLGLAMLMGLQATLVILVSAPVHGAG